MSVVPNPGSALSQYLEMTETANAIGDVFFQKHGGSAIGRMEHDLDSGMHFIPVTGMIHDIEVAKTHVWEDGRIEEVFGA